MFRVLATGPQTLYQDLGRPGYASLGVSPSGCFDRLSSARANHALGNDPAAPVLEILVGGLILEALSPASLMFAGTQTAVTVRKPDGKQLSEYTNTIIEVLPGDRVELGHATYGMRTYLAVRGGFVAPLQLGSAATDTLGGLGPAPIRPGTQLQIGNQVAEQTWWPVLRNLPPLWQRRSEEVLTVSLGPRTGWFAGETIASLFTQKFTIQADSNRVGVRLTAQQPLLHYRKQELASEGMVRGAIQVPPSGHPVIFGPDYPVTGGYPVIAVLVGRSADRLAQLGPGDTIRFEAG